MTKDHSPMPSLAGLPIRFSSFHRLGGGPWSGQVVDKNDREFEIEELASSWRVTPVDGGTSVTKRSLDEALKRAVDGRL